MISNGGCNEQQLLVETSYPGNPVVPDDNPGSLDRLPSLAATASLHRAVGAAVPGERRPGYR